MILYIKHYEQLCNRLWAFLPALAYALHFNKTILMFGAYKPYMDLFPNLRKCHNVRSYKETSQFQYRRLVHKFWNIYEKTLVLRKPLRNVSPCTPVIFAAGWEGREDPSFIKEEKEKIIDLFCPRREIVDFVNSRIKKNQGVCYVGVHVRRGDYQNFFDGRFFYELSFYYDLMNQLYKLLSTDSTDVKFVICSNENFDITSCSLLEKVSFKQENIVHFENANAITDLYALSKCDYIFGPPSTFSQWASFYGGGKLLFVKNKNIKKIRLEDFKTIELYESPFKEFRKYWKGKKVWRDE